MARPWQSVSVIALALGAVLLLSACSNGDQAAAPASSTSEQNSYETCADWNALAAPLRVAFAGSAAGPLSGDTDKVYRPDDVRDWLDHACVSSEYFEKGLEEALVGGILSGDLVGVSASVPGEGTDSEANTPPPAPAISEAERRRGERNRLIGQSLRSLAREYSAGRFAGASRYMSQRVAEQCGGRAGLTDALRQLHDIEGIAYRITTVEIPKRSAKGDVRIIETSSLGTNESVLGLGPFVREGGVWVLDDLFPLGVGAFC